MDDNTPNSDLASRSSLPPSISHPSANPEPTGLPRSAAAFDKAVESIGSALTSRLDQILDVLIERLPERPNPDPKIQQLVGWNEAGEKAKVKAEQERIADERADLTSPSGAKPFDPRIGFMRRLDGILFPEATFSSLETRQNQLVDLFNDITHKLTIDDFRGVQR